MKGQSGLNQNKVEEDEDMNNEDDDQYSEESEETLRGANLGAE
jgi:hypothetical protein